MCFGPNTACDSPPVVQYSETIRCGSLSYWPYRTGNSWIRRDWLFTMPSKIQKGFAVRVKWIRAKNGAGSLSIRSVESGGWPDSHKHPFYVFNRSFSISRLEDNFLTRSLNISLRATDYFVFVLVFRLEASYPNPIKPDPNPTFSGRVKKKLM